MALLWIDGFEGYGITSTPSGIGYRYPGFSTSNITVQAGRLTGYCIWEVSTGQTLITPPLTQDPTLIVGCAFMAQNTTAVRTIGFYDNAVLGINVQITASIPSVVVTKLSGVTIDTTTLNTVLRINTWYYLEVKVYCHSSAGTVEVRIDGATVVSLSGINTRQGTDAFHNIIRFTIDYTGLDDVYICDGTTATLNNFLGVCKVLAVFPNADTATVQWTPQSGSTHYTMVDENPVSTVDYVQSATQAQIDLYSYPSLIGNSTILGIQVSTTVWLSAGMDIILEIPIVSNGITELGPDTQLVSVNAEDAMHISVTDPNTSAPWTIANLAAAQIGVKVM